MTEHKHAAVLRAIADGVPLSEFEVRVLPNDGGAQWQPLKWATIIPYPNDWESRRKPRRKPQYILVNGFKVPKPMSEAKNGQGVWVTVPWTLQWTFNYTFNDQVEWHRLALARGMFHETETAAIAHSKAMLRINPEF